MLQILSVTIFVQEIEDLGVFPLIEYLRVGVFPLPVGNDLPDSSTRTSDLSFHRMTTSLVEQFVEKGEREMGGIGRATTPEMAQRATTRRWVHDMFVSASAKADGDKC